MRSSYLTLSFLLLATSCCAREHRINKKLFTAELATLSLSKGFDAKTTSDLIKCGGYEVQSRWAIGRRPSDARIAGYFAIELALQGSLLYYGERSRRWWVRWPVRAYIAFVVEEHVRNAIANRNVCARGCSPPMLEVRW